MSEPICVIFSILRHYFVNFILNKSVTVLLVGRRVEAEPRSFPAYVQRSSIVPAQPQHHHQQRYQKERWGRWQSTVLFVSKSCCQSQLT